MAGGWYLECSRGYVPKEEEDLYNSLVRSAPDVCDVVEEPDEDVDVEPPVKVKEKVVPPVKGKKGKKGKNDVPQASTQVTTRSYTRATSQRTSVPDTSTLGSPSAAPSIASPVPIIVAPTPPPPIALSLEPSCAPSVAPSPTPSDAPSEQAPSDQPPIPSESNVTVPSLPRKRRASTFDNSATSSEKPTTLSLIENVDMVEILEVRRKTGTFHPAYNRIQDFLTKVFILSPCIALIYLCCIDDLQIIHFLIFSYSSSSSFILH